MSDGQTGHRTDRTELKELIKEFTSRYNYLHEKRIHKLLFYSEIYTLQNYGHRISNADFKPYDYGPYAELIRELLQEMIDNGELLLDHRDGNATVRHNEPGNISDFKRNLVDEIHEETRSMRTYELVQFAKDTTAWKTHEYDQVIDFEAYLADAVLSKEARDDLATRSRQPASPEQVAAVLD